MLDLAKPLGTYEGLIFYGDHEIGDLVYYFPDEVSLAPQANPDGSPSPFYELYFQIFSEGVVSEGGAGALRDTAGSILSIGAQCSVNPDRLTKALDQLKATVAAPEKIRATTPPWKDGSVNLIVLDASANKDETMGRDAFVKSIVGSDKPSLMSSGLESIFNVRLDRRGTAIIQAALEGDTGNIAGVLYDLKFTAIRPAVDLRIWANLDRCYESIAHQLGIKAEFTYYVKFSLGAELNWLTKKMEEDGDLKIEVLSQVEDAETKKMIDEMVSDFKESVLREMFQPFVNPSIPAVPIGEGLVPVVGVSYKFTKENITQNKILEVDYRERSAVIRTHNPQSHLWVLGKQIAANKDKYIQKIIVSDVWREQQLSISIGYDFEAPDADLLSAEIVIWRYADGFDARTQTGRFAIPEGATPVKSITFHKDDTTKREIAWLYDEEEPFGYYYQIRFVYSGKIANINSPSEIITEPVYAASEQLIIFPDTYTFFKKIEVREGNIDFDEIKGVDITLNIKDSESTITGTELITINENNRDEIWTVRGADKQALYIEAIKEFHYRDGRPSLQTEPLYLQDDEVLINKPFQRSAIDLIPVIAGKKDNVNEVLLEIIVTSPTLDDPLKKVYRITGPSFNGDSIRIGLNSDKDIITYKADAIMSDGQVMSVNSGTITSNALVIDLNRLSNRELVFTWTGRSAAAAGVKELIVEIRERNGNGILLDTIIYSGDHIPEPVIKVFPKETLLEYRIIKRYNNGSKEKENFISVISNNIPVNPD